MSHNAGKEVSSPPPQTDVSRAVKTKYPQSVASSILILRRNVYMILEFWTECPDVSTSLLKITGDGV